MKAVCINNGNGLLNLTVGKVYDYNHTLYDQYNIADDFGIMYYFNKKHFIGLEEYREQKLNELGL